MYCAGSAAFTRKWLVVVPGGSANLRGRGQAWTPWCELNTCSLWLCILSDFSTNVEYPPQVAAREGYGPGGRQWGTRWTNQSWFIFGDSD